MKLDSTGRLITKLFSTLAFGLCLGCFAASASTLSLEILQKRLGMSTWAFLVLSVFLFGYGWFTEEIS